MPRPLYILLLFASLGPVRAAEPYEGYPDERKKRLLAGNAVVLEKRPDETAEVDTRFVTVAKLIRGSRETIWNVIHDKDDAEKFLDGVLESRVISSGENEIVVTQKTHVGGPKGAYRYTLRHKLQPMKRADFAFVKGEIRDVIGTWWIFKGPDGKRMLVVYSLHIDPGAFAPQFVVKRGMKKTIPATLSSIEKEVTRRNKEGHGPP
ncbi:MAG: hypothetical protein MI807_03575 [Verrucomicrobiales bacterium]|nr:hypothetical protein [Verrucomicrobiales bacterium]